MIITWKTLEFQKRDHKKLNRQCCYDHPSLQVAIAAMVLATFNFSTSTAIAVVAWGYRWH